MPKYKTELHVLSEMPSSGIFIVCLSFALTPFYYATHIGYASDVTIRFVDFRHVELLVNS